MIGHSDFAKINSYSTVFYILALIMFIAILIAATFGTIGISKRNTKFLSVYISIVWGLFIYFWVLFAVFIKRKVTLEKQVIDYCGTNMRVKNGIMSVLQEAYPNSLSTSFCTENCPCASNHTRFPSTSEYMSAVFDNSGAKNVFQCLGNI